MYYDIIQDPERVGWFQKKNILQSYLYRRNRILDHPTPIPILECDEIPGGGGVLYKLLGGYVPLGL